MSSTGFQASTTEQNKEIARRYLQEIGAAGALDRLEEFVAPDVVNHDPVSGEEADAGMERGIQAFRRHAEAVVYGLSDREFDIRDVIAEDDRVMVRIVLSGTHTGRLMGIAPTGRRVRFSSIVIYRIRNGKIIERWDEANTLGLLGQLGALPEQAPQVGQTTPGTLEQSQPSQPPQQFQQQPSQQVPQGVQQPQQFQQPPPQQASHGARHPGQQFWSEQRSRQYDRREQQPQEPR